MLNRRETAYNNISDCEAYAYWRLFSFSPTGSTNPWEESQYAIGHLAAVQ